MYICLHGVLEHVNIHVIMYLIVEHMRMVTSVAGFVALLLLTLEEAVPFVCVLLIEACSRSCLRGLRAFAFLLLLPFLHVDEVFTPLAPGLPIKKVRLVVMLLWLYEVCCDLVHVSEKVVHSLRW